MTNQGLNNNLGIEMTDCAKCRGCCGDVGGEKFNQIMLSYEFLEAIEANKIPEKIIQQMIIYKIPAQTLDAAAKYLRMYPVDNLMRHMTTLDPEGYYEFMSLPKGKCTLLGPSGCQFLEFKPYICAIFPFYIYKLQPYYSYGCVACDKIENDILVRESAGRLIIHYIIAAEQHKEQYRPTLERIKQNYCLKVVEVQSYYPDMVYRK
jgi:Fe-S-cluster containining protein